MRRDRHVPSPRLVRPVHQRPTTPRIPRRRPVHNRVVRRHHHQHRPRQVRRLVTLAANLRRDLAQTRLNLRRHHQHLRPRSAQRLRTTQRHPTPTHNHTTTPPHVQHHRQVRHINNPAPRKTTHQPKHHPTHHHHPPHRKQPPQPMNRTRHARTHPPRAKKEAPRPGCLTPHRGMFDIQRPATDQPLPNQPVKSGDKCPPGKRSDPACSCARSQPLQPFHRNET